MSAPETDPPVLCPYMEQGQTGPICDVPTNGPLCDTHMEPRFSVCDGCAGFAMRLCTEDGPHAKPLCGECRHLGTGVHGPLKAEETPLAPGEPPTGGTPPTIEGVRNDLVETAVLSMRAARRQDPPLSDHEIASKLIDDLGTSVLLGMIQGLAQVRAAQNGG